MGINTDNASSSNWHTTLFIMGNQWRCLLAPPLWLPGRHEALNQARAPGQLAHCTETWAGGVCWRNGEVPRTFFTPAQHRVLEGSFLVQLQTVTATLRTDGQDIFCRRCRSTG